MAPSRQPQFPTRVPKSVASGRKLIGWNIAKHFEDGTIASTCSMLGALPRLSLSKYRALASRICPYILSINTITYKRYRDVTILATKLT